MSDPVAARAQSSTSGEAAGRPDGPERPGRLVTIVAVARALLIATGLVTAYYLLPLDGPRSGGAVALLVCGLLAVAVVFAWELRTIVRSPYPRLKAVEAFAAVLALYLVAFAATYDLLEKTTPGSFSEPLTRTDALYFTLTTFSTVGFGDVTAESQTARMVTMLQMAGGLLLFGVAARILMRAVQTGLQARGDGRTAVEDKR